MLQVVDNISRQAGAHALRAGADFVFNDDTITYPRSSRGSYAFSSLANFLIGSYSGFTQTFGDPVISQTNPNIGMYAQDEWRVGARVTLNLGLRYELQFIETVNTGTNNVSPRAGFAWSPSASSDLVIRGSAGLFFDRVPLRAVDSATPMLPMVLGLFDHLRRLEKHLEPRRIVCRLSVAFPPAVLSPAMNLRRPADVKRPADESHEYSPSPVS
jgi:hypothetical protein